MADPTPPTGAPAALDLLRAAYSSRTAPASAADAVVVGVVGRDVPVELVSAAGAVPLPLRGRREATPDADAILGTGLDPAIRAVLQGILTGAYGRLDALLIASDTDATQRLFYVLREMRRTQPERGIPPVHLIDILHLPRESTARYNLVRMTELVEVLAGWTGHRPTADELRAAIDAEAEVRDAQRALEALRTPVARLSGADSLAAVGARWHLERDGYLAALRELSADADALPAVAGIRVLLTGSAHDTDDVHRAIEQSGAVVVGDDHAFAGSALPHPFAPEGDLTALLDALGRSYQLAPPTPARASMRERAAHTTALADACAAELALSYVRERDEAALWDFAALRASLPIPAAIVRDQPYAAVDEAALRTALTNPTQTGVNA